LQAGVAALALIAGSGGALAQDCSALIVNTEFSGSFDLTLSGGPAAGVASAVAGSLGNVATAFLTNQTSAFVAGSTSTRPEQTSGGIWVRGVGGLVETKSETDVAGAVNIPARPDSGSTTGTCTSKVRQSFWGFQAGRDIAVLDWNGWNFHVGATAGYLGARGEDIAGVIDPIFNPNNPGNIKSDFQVPFLGTYAVATRGSFFSDIMVRREFYNIGLDQPLYNLNSQRFGARAWSVSVGAGYNHALGEGWFVEPSAGFMWSRTAVDPIAFPGAATGGTLQVDDIDSKLGRATVRVGRNISDNGMAWQPFASASVFHEFAGNVTANFQSCNPCLVTADAGDPILTSLATSTTRVGTYGQFSVGVAGQVIDTGWVGFVRGDYRTGQNIEGVTGSAGLRYNFMPERDNRVGKLVVKAPPPPLPYIWAGFYVGGHVGVIQGKAHIGFYDPASTRVDPHVAGYLGGFQGGFNFQNGPFVFGIEAEISTTNANGTHKCGSDPGTTVQLNQFGEFAPVTERFTSLFFTCESTLEWMATAAGRLGLVSWWSDRVLLFVKGGGAWTRQTVTVDCIDVIPCHNPANQPTTGGFYAKDNRFGGMIGAGAEFGLTRNWSAKAEWSYIRFQDRDVTATDGTLINLGASITQAKVGVNYRFDAAPLPVAAKY
jgi:outer membrane autotransporter protein